MPRTAAPEGPGERVALLSRTTIELRKQLENAASLSGRSLSQEVERRLERTFDLDHLMGDSETALVIRTIGSAIRRFEVASGKQWTEDDVTQEAAFEAATRILEVIMRPYRGLKPEGEAIPVNPSDAYTLRGMKNIAIGQAIGALQSYLRLQEQEAIKLRPSKTSR